MIGAIALVVIAIILIVVGELDRKPVGPRRFGVGLRRSHLQLHGSNRRPWRWMIHALYTPDALDVIIGTGHTTKLSGRARTYLGALYAGCRARRLLEEELAQDRARFLEQLFDGGSLVGPAVVESDTHAVFPAETSEDQR